MQGQRLRASSQQDTSQMYSEENADSIASTQHQTSGFTYPEKHRADRFPKKADSTNLLSRSPLDKPGASPLGISPTRVLTCGRLEMPSPRIRPVLRHIAARTPIGFNERIKSVYCGS